MQLYPWHYMPLPFCLQNILFLYTFVQQGAVKETEKCSPKHWPPRSGKEVQGTRDKSILTSMSLKIVTKNKTWDVHKYFSSSKTDRNLFLPQWSKHIPVKYLGWCVGCKSARNRKQKGKDPKDFWTPCHILRTSYIQNSAEHSRYLGMLLLAR